ncbi:hypothetical protein CPC08DRAFT_769071 [Agrocybe pediades]|nr:hypothetical protein CPC08DRAFT_769071 [Agrocybe pediades]
MTAASIRKKASLLSFAATASTVFTTCIMGTTCSWLPYDVLVDDNDAERTARTTVPSSEPGRAVLLIGNGSSLSSVSGATDRKDSLEMKSTVWLVIEGAVVDKSRTGVVEFIGLLLSETLSLSIALGFRSLYRLAAWNGISVRL